MHKSKYNKSSKNYSNKKSYSSNTKRNWKLDTEKKSSLVDAIIKSIPEQSIFEDYLKMNKPDIEVNDESSNVCCFIPHTMYSHKTSLKKIDGKWPDPVVVCEIKNASSFWGFFNNYTVAKRHMNYSFYLMKNPVMPIWEDKNNISIVSVSFLEDAGIKFFEDISVIYLCNQLFTNNNIINGISFVPKHKFAIKIENNKQLIDKDIVLIKIWLSIIDGIKYCNELKYHKMLGKYFNEKSDIQFQILQK